uniref:Uncharacterized protein n=1 Tax=Rhizobium leguminosarum bv. viciae TaxID=387 RepID=A0A0U3K576_RHILV|nr:hypothetical protein [Rhizobium leguminosarum bv. viciae]
MARRAPPYDHVSARATATPPPSDQDDPAKIVSLTRLKNHQKTSR